MPEPSITNAGLDVPRGVGRVLVPFRWLIRRLLRAPLRRVETTLTAMETRMEVMSEQNEMSNRRARQAAAFGWDYVALVRRVTVLEDLVEELRAELAAQRTDGEPPRTIPLPNADAGPASYRHADL